MKSLTKIAHGTASKFLQTGDIAIDLTAGNGLDTLFLARCVGATGQVYAFDIQSSAIRATQELLIKHSFDSCVTLYRESHSNWSTKLSQELKHGIKVVMMNLGYRPGGDRSLVTEIASTLAAIDIALDWLQPGGLLSVLAYTGHPGGKSESEAVHAKLMVLDKKEFEFQQEPTSPVEGVPVLYLVSRKFVRT